MDVVVAAPAEWMPIHPYVMSAIHWDVLSTFSHLFIETNHKRTVSRLDSRIHGQETEQFAAC